MIPIVVQARMDSRRLYGKVLMFNLVSMPEPKQYGFPEIPGDYTDIEDDKKQIENIKRTDPAHAASKEVKDMIRKGKPKYVGYFEQLKDYIFGR